MSSIKIPPIPVLKKLLDATDEFAVGTVKAGQGGPFGASIHIYDPETGKTEQIGKLAANAVLKKGMASAHAENEVISPENVAMLKTRLRDYDAKKVQVILSSSGQSCPACKSKEEILARELVATNLIKRGNFIVTYGATYADTFNVAGFNDAPYQEDMKHEPGTGMVKHDSMSIVDIPEGLRKIFMDAAKPVAIVANADRILGVGYDTRKESGDITATAEVSAIRAACTAAKAAGAETPWDLGEAALFTSTYNMGPMAYAECQWANVTDWVHVHHANDEAFKTREAVDSPNYVFFRMVGSGWDEASDTITTVRIRNFANLAQHAWQDKLKAEADPSKILYNGIKTEAPNGP